MATLPSETKPPLLLYSAFSIVTLFFLYSQITSYLQRRRFMREHGCQPLAKRYNKDPIFGLDVMRENMAADKTKTFLSLNYNRFHSLGIWTFGNRLFHIPMISTVEPENVKTVLSVRFKDYSMGLRRPYLSPLLGDGIFNSDGERWASSRHLLRPSFAREHLADLDAFEGHFRHLLNAIPKDGSAFDIQELFFRLTLDSATEFLFNHSTHSLKMVGKDDQFDEDAEFAEAFNTAQLEIVKNMRFAALRRFRSQKKCDEANRICHAYVQKFVDEAIAYRERRDAELKAAGKSEADEKEEKYIFIHELAKQVTDKRRLRDELMNILLAGRDTTASVLSNMFFEIAKQPAIWQKLREEIGVLNGRCPTYEELRNFKYLKWCINECKQAFFFPINCPISGLTSSIISSLYILWTWKSNTIITSPPPLPRRPSKQPPGHPRHHPAPGWRSHRQIAPLRPPRHRRRLLPFHHAPARRPLRPRRPVLQPLSLGNPPSRLGICPLQRRPKDLPGTAVCVDRSELCDCEAGAGVQGAEE